MDRMSGIQARIANRRRTTTRAARRISSLPAPILGLNARDSFDDMDPRFAVVLDNYFPDGTDVRVRNGNVDHVTGITGPVEFLHMAALGSTEKLIGFANNSAYDVTGGGAVGAPLASGFANNRWTGVNAGANGGERAIYTNGINPAQAYDGSAWAAAGLTGPTAPAGVAVAAKRLWVIQRGTGEAWYSPPEAVTGAMAKFDIGSVTPDGGELVAIGAVTVDGGQGPDDATVFVMKSGAVVIYRGTDPSDAANWGLQGVWKAGRPIGDRCLVPFDKDLIIVTDVGFQSILRFTTGGGISGVPISDNIRRIVSDSTRQFENNYGWNGLYNPQRRQLIFNIPILQAAASWQYVMNSISGAWCRYTGVNALCHAVLGSDRYIGVVGKVMKADIGGVDGNLPVNGTIQTAWGYFGLRGAPKHFKQYRVKIKSDSILKIGLGIGADFIDPIASVLVTIGSPTGGEWDIATWDVDSWGGGLVNFNDWRGAGREGTNASILIRTETQNADVEYLSSDVIFEPADI